MNSEKENSALNKELVEELWRDVLEKAGVPLELWGKGEAKTLSHLVGEISRRATNFFFDEKEEKWVREVRPVEVHVFYESPEGVTYFLREEKQVFKDGRERRRNYPWVGEKMEKDDEDSLAAAVRAIEEEVGLIPPFASGPNFTGDKEIQRDSGSYPGIVSRHSVSCFEVYLTPEQFNPEGYIEEQEEKSTFVVWEKK